MARILYLVRNEAAAERARAAAEQFEHDVAVEICSPEQVEARLDKAEREGICVTVLKGGLQHRLNGRPREMVYFNGVFLGMDTVDTIAAVQEQYPDKHLKIGFISNYNILGNQEILETAMDTELVFFQANPDDPVQAARKVREAVAVGCDVLVCPPEVQMIAERYHLPAYRHAGSDQEGDLVELFRMAQLIANQVELARMRNHMMMEVLNRSSSAFVQVSRDGRIMIWNRAAEKLFCRSWKSVRGCRAWEILPELLPMRDVLTGNREPLESGWKKQTFSGVRTLMRLSASQEEGTVLEIVSQETAENQEADLHQAVYEQGLVAKWGLEDIIGNSDAIARIIDLAKKFAQSDGSILIQGETGTGKERMAHGIHRAGSAPEGRFVTVRCAALETGSLERKLHGDFTRHCRGALELADGGTLYLDEVGDLDADAQSCLLRALDSGCCSPDGDSRMKNVRFRLISSSSRDLGQMVKDGLFRTDLYYRIAALSLNVPPLRERKEDIPALIQESMRKHNAKCGRNLLLTDGAVEKLTEYPWPGNLRQLDQFCQRLVLVCEGGEADEEAVIRNLEEAYGYSVPELTLGGPSEKILVVPQRSTAANPTAEDIRAALEKSSQNRQAAADSLGISRSTLWRLMKKYGLA